MVQTCKFDLTALFRPGFYRALGDPSRIALLARLAQAGGACTVSEIAAGSSIDLSVVSRHLATLRDAGIVESTRRGREVLYTFRTEAVVSALRTLADALESCCSSVSNTSAPTDPSKGKS